MTCSHKIGIPLSEVGDRLKTLNESLLQNGMALKADTGVHIDCNRDGKTATSFILEVYLFEKEEGKENECTVR